MRVREVLLTPGRARTSGGRERARVTVSCPRSFYPSTPFRVLVFYASRILRDDSVSRGVVPSSFAQVENNRDDDHKNKDTANRSDRTNDDDLGV